MNEITNILGMRFGRLIVSNKIHSSIGNKTYYLCICDCGNTKKIQKSALMAGKTQSCGCKKIEKQIRCGEIIGDTWTAIKNNAKYRNIEFELTIQEIWNLFLSQDRKCALTGENLYFNKNKKDRNDRTASLDRIDSNLGYTTSNVWWIHKKINKLKIDFDLKEFIYWCKMVSNFKIQSGIKYCIAPEETEEQRSRWGKDFELTNQMFDEAGVKLQLVNYNIL